MDPSIPIPTLHLFHELDLLLLSKLKSLNKEQWQKQTLAGNWTVKNLASHLLDGNYRAISMIRDGYFGRKPEAIDSYGDLVEYLNRLNADWIRATDRLSPQVLIRLLEESGFEYRAMLQSLKPFENALFSVAWAGENESLNWFHIAREFTEKWHHTQQIFYALDGSDQTLLTEKFYLPYLETSMKALSVHYQKLELSENLMLKVTVIGNFKKDWWLQRSDGKWNLIPFSSSKPDTSIRVPDQLAWRIFTKGISPSSAEKFVEITGNRHLGEHFLKMLAVMA